MADVKHIPVMLGEALTTLDVQAGGRYVDCTLGGAGHAEAIL
ncbi:MAG: 16S rRNA (cytosine(1402)-N(4))-methyltransferase, partial [Dehalococcoidia bacterium]